MTAIASLHRYPIKSCQGATVASVELTENGVVGDREFMVIDADGDHGLINQLRSARLASVHAALDGGALHIAAPNVGELAVTVRSDGPTFASALYGSPLAALDQGDEAAEWFSDLTRTSARLVRITTPFQRFLPIPGFEPVDQQKRNNATDAGPVMIANQATLDDLNTRLSEPVGMDRFRPNIVIADWPAFAEDDWAQAELGALGFTHLSACERCAIICTDQTTGARGQEPLATLKTYRHRADGYGSGVMFGAYAVPTVTGTLRVGDPARFS